MRGRILFPTDPLELTLAADFTFDHDELVMLWVTSSFVVAFLDHQPVLRKPAAMPLIVAASA